MIKRQEQAGLGYHTDASDTPDKLGKYTEVHSVYILLIEAKDDKMPTFDRALIPLNTNMFISYFHEMLWLFQQKTTLYSH